MTYRVRPFSGGDEGRAAYHRHAERAGDRDPCAICGRTVLNPKHRATVTADMGSWCADDVEPNGGSFPVGSDCHRKYAGPTNETGSEHVTLTTVCSLCGHYHTRGTCDLDCGCGEVAS